MPVFIEEPLWPIPLDAGLLRLRHSLRSSLSHGDVAFLLRGLGTDSRRARLVVVTNRSRATIDAAICRAGVGCTVAAVVRRVEIRGLPTCGRLLESRSTARSRESLTRHSAASELYCGRGVPRTFLIGSERDLERLRTWYHLEMVP